MPGGKKTKRTASAGKPVKLTIDDAMGRLSYGKFQVHLKWVAAVAQLAGCMQTMVGFFFPQAIQPEWNLSDFQTASVTSVLFLGSMVGFPVVAIWLRDSYGVRWTYLVSALASPVLGLLGALSPNYYLLILCRFLLGFALAGAMTPWYYVAEFMPHHVRAEALLSLGLAWSAGNVIVPFLGIYLLASNDRWRWMLFACSIPGIPAFVLGFAYLPESPRWLMSKGQSDAALQILRDAALLNEQDPWAICPQSTHLMRGGKTKSKWKVVARLFAKEVRLLTLSLLPVFLAVDFLYYTYIQLIHMAVSDTDGDENVFAFYLISITAVAELVGTVVAIVSVDVIGRVPTQAVAYALASIFILAVCIGRHFEESRPEGVEDNYIFYLSFFARLFIMTATSVTWVHTNEMIPKKIRATLHATSRSLASLGAAASAYHMLFPALSHMVVGIVVGVITLVLSLFIATFPETKDLAIGNDVRESISRNGAFSDQSNMDEKHALTSGSDEPLVTTV